MRLQDCRHQHKLASDRRLKEKKKKCSVGHLVSGETK